MDSQGMKGFYSMKKSEWEETQGNGASIWLPAGTSSSEICLINTSELGCGTRRGANVGKGLMWGQPLCWSPLECLVGYISFSFRRHECRGLPVAWWLLGTQHTYSADGKPQGLM